MQNNFERFQEVYPDAELSPIEGCDNCIVGIAERFGGFVNLVYDEKKLKQKKKKQSTSGFVILHGFNNAKKACEAFPSEEFLQVDGFGKCFLGVACWENFKVFAYDREKIISTLMRRDKMSYEGALEFFDFNIIGSYVGEKTPIFVTTVKDFIGD